MAFSLLDAGATGANDDNQVLASVPVDVFPVGTLVVVGIAYVGDDAPTGITDTQGNTYTVVSTEHTTTPGDILGLCIAYSRITNELDGNAPDFLQVDFDSVRDAIVAMLLVDGSTSGITAIIGGSTADDFTAVRTSGSHTPDEDSFLVAFWADGEATVSNVPDAGWSDLFSGGTGIGDIGICAQYKSASSGLQSGTATSDSFDDWVGTLIAFDNGTVLLGNGDGFLAIL